MNVSVVIPAINESECIARSIQSARAAGAYEVIVVDGGSGDETPEIARQLDSHVVESPPGRARQQNAGAQAASGDVLLFQHADNWLAADSLEQIRGPLANDELWGGAFRQRIEAPGHLFRWLEAGNASRVRWFGLPYGDQGIFVRRDVFFDVGGFPEEPLMEDVMLMTRLRRRTWPLLLPGPLHVSARRWQRHGVFRQTCRNWALLSAYRLGVSPATLAGYYRRHDTAKL